MVLPHIKKRVSISNNIQNIIKTKQKTQNAKRTRLLKETANKQNRQIDVEIPTPYQVESKHFEENPKSINLQLKKLLLNHKTVEKNELLIQQKESFNLYTIQCNEKQYMYSLHKNQKEELLRLQTQRLFLLKQIHKSEEDQMLELYILNQDIEDRPDVNEDQVKNHPAQKKQ